MTGEGFKNKSDDDRTEPGTQLGVLNEASLKLGFDEKTHVCER